MRGPGRGRRKRRRKKRQVGFNRQFTINSGIACCACRSFVLGGVAHTQKPPTARSAGDLSSSASSTPPQRTLPCIQSIGTSSMPSRHSASGRWISGRPVLLSRQFSLDKTGSRVGRRRLEPGAWGVLVIPADRCAHVNALATERTSSRLAPFQRVQKGAHPWVVLCLGLSVRGGSVDDYRSKQASSIGMHACLLPRCHGCQL